MWVCVCGYVCVRVVSCHALLSHAHYVPAASPASCAPQQYDNKEVFRAVLFSDLDFTSPPWDILSGGCGQHARRQAGGCVQGAGARAWGGCCVALSARLRPADPGRPGTRPAACLPAAADAAFDFFQACLNRDEKERPTAEQLLEHPWLQVRGRSGVPRAAAVRTWAHVGGCKAYSALRVNSEHLRTVEAVNSAALSPLCARPCCPPTGRPGGERRPV